MKSTVKLTFAVASLLGATVAQVLPADCVNDAVTAAILDKEGTDDILSNA